MKFKDLELYHVGRHNGPVFAGLLDGLNVVYGPNEAGKSTLMAGLRAMLFGRLTGSEPHLGTVRGASGTLRAESEAGHLYTLERALGRRSPVKVYGPEFEPQVGDEGLFAAFPELEKLESTIYQSVFTFQLQELSDLSEHRGQLAQKLYTVGMIGSTSPLQMEETFRKSAKAIYNPDKRARNPLLTQCLGSLSELKEEQSKQQDEVAAYLAVQDEAGNVEKQLREQEQTLEQLADKRSYLHRLKQALPLYQSAQSSLAEQELYGSRYEIPEAAVARAQQHEADIDRLKKENSQSQEALRSLSAEREQTEVNSEILSVFPQIQKQAQQREKMLTLADWIDEGRQTVTKLQADNEELSSRLSGNWSLEELLQLEITAQTVTNTAQHEEEWKQLQTQRQHLNQQVHTWREHLEQRSRRIHSLGISTESAAAHIEQQQEELKYKRGQLYSDEEHVETYAELSEQKANINQDIQEIQNQAARELDHGTDTRDKTAGAVAGLAGVLAALGVWQITRAALAAGIVTWLAAIVAVGISLWIWKRRHLQRDSRSAQGLKERLSELQDRAQQSQEAMNTVLTKIQSLPREEGVSPWGLRKSVKQRQLELDEEADRLRNLQSAADLLAEAERALASLLEQIQYVERQEEKLQQASYELQQAIGGSSQRRVSVTTWVGELQILQEILQNQWEIRRQLKKIGAYEGEVRSFVAEVNRLMPDSGGWSSTDREGELAAAGSADNFAALWSQAAVEHFQSEIHLVLAQLRDASDKLPQLLREAETAKAQLQQRQAVERRLYEVRTALTKRQQELRKTEAEVTEIYQRCTAANQAEFHQFLDEVKVYQGLKSTYRDAMMQLYGLCGGKEQYEELQEKLRNSTMEQIEEDLALNQKQLDEARETYQNLNAQLAEQQARLNHWDSEQREKLEWQLAQAKAERDKLAFEWAGYRLAEALVKTARERYEEQRQPEVLQTAGKLFRQVTSGRYQGLKSRFDEQGAARFVAVDAGNQEWSFESLSRGTREQIYLSLRIGLIRDYVNRGVKMPLVLDDPLVNFDAERLDASLRLLAETAGDCQIIYLTCHRRTVERIHNIVPAHNVELGLTQGER